MRKKGVRCGHKRGIREGNRKRRTGGEGEQEGEEGGKGRSGRLQGRRTGKGEVRG
jgi:hypothetical protein